MAKVYLVMQGSYSDRTVCGIYSSMEAAKAALGGWRAALEACGKNSTDGGWEGEVATFSACVQQFGVSGGKWKKFYNHYDIPEILVYELDPPKTDLEEPRGTYRTMFYFEIERDSGDMVVNERNCDKYTNGAFVDPGARVFQKCASHFRDPKRGKVQTFVCWSVESTEHAQKVCAEMRQAWLREQTLLTKQEG